MTQISRRDLLRGGAGLAAAGGAAMLLPACGSSSGSSSTNSSGTTTISVWQHQEPAFNDAYAKVAAEFEKTHKGVKINSLYIPFAELATKTLTAFAGGTPPDVAKLYGGDFASFSSKGMFAAVDYKAMGYPSLPALKSAFMPNSMNQLVYNGTQYGLPVDWNALLLIYSIDDFKEVGLDPSTPPATWADVLTYGQKLTKRDSAGNVTRAGFQWVYDGGTTWDYLNMLMLVNGMGGSLLTSSGGGNLNNAEGVRALTYYGDMSTKYKISSPNITGPAYDQGTFAQGKVSMYIASNWAIPLILAADKKLKEGVNFTVAPVPQWGSSATVVPAYTYGWAVAKSTKNPELVWEFLKFMESRTNAGALLSASDVVEPVANWQQLNPSDPGTQLMAKAAPDLVYGQPSPNFEQIASTLSTGIQSLARGQTTAAKFAAQFDATSFGS